ncbi:hypothetical protein CKO28_25600 [Rhodovibrio sodomensis]|uniref:Methyltransferase n=1 Tax=Rhodovibrio sodomensis TaxID=1088 RepID=A0ABS1DLH0_9PROT|nr:SAM-dependent methyltransferase [Rhodovibrio sodomensis]MBK1671380.1 hypothetical protein [Rhodovibrio sodomensis]
MPRTALEQRLIRRLRSTGPISVASYMADVLTAPDGGYYSGGEAGDRDPFGWTGDFVTAPEISQMFGELLGLWCAEAWQRLGEPDPVTLAELGPGRGTLMADALRAAKMLPGFDRALAVHLVEVSRALRHQQAEALGARIAGFHDQVADLPDGPALVIANEFFDALPVRQFEKTDRGWSERMVAYDPERDRLVFALGAPSQNAAAYVPEHLRQTAQPGAVFELAPSALSIANDLGRRVAHDGGAVILVDYGRSETRLEATLQAVRRHQRADVLSAPGTADLTAHVDFPLIAQAAREAGAEVHGPVPQRDFLKGLGLDQRAEILKQQANPEQRAQIETGHHRLTAADQMGTLFQAMAFVPPGYGTPAGFPA